MFLPYIYTLESWLGGDKLMHLKLSFGLSLLALMTFVQAKAITKGLFQSFVVCFILISGLLVDEFHQALVSTRRFEWLDLSYGVTGIFMGLLLFIFASLVLNRIQK
jgi:VanZ family protein